MPSSPRRLRVVFVLAVLAVLTSAGKVFLDNTGVLSNAVVSSSPTVVTSSLKGASFAFNVLETDSACGPARYALSNVSLVLSQDVSDGGYFTMGLTLYAATASSGIPGATVVNFAFSSQLVTAVPTYYAIKLPSLWYLDTSAGLNTTFALVVSTYDKPFKLHTVTVAGDATAAPTGELAAPVSNLLAATASGSSWSTIQPWRGIQIQGYKMTCSPSGSGTQSQSATQTQTQTQSRSGTKTGSRSASQSASTSQSASQSPSQTKSPSLSQSGSASGTMTPSLSPTISDSASQSASGAATPSGTPTQAYSFSLSQTGTRTATATPSRSQTRTLSLTQTMSATASQSQSASQSGSAGILYTAFDNTNSLAAGIDWASTPALTVDTANTMRIAFQIPETDATCGPAPYVFQVRRCACSGPHLPVAASSPPPFGLLQEMALAIAAPNPAPVPAPYSTLIVAVLYINGPDLVSPVSTVAVRETAGGDAMLLGSQPS